MPFIRQSSSSLPFRAILDDLRETFERLYPIEVAGVAQFRKQVLECKAGESKMHEDGVIKSALLA